MIFIIAMLAAFIIYLLFTMQGLSNERDQAVWDYKALRDLDAPKVETKKNSATTSKTAQKTATGAVPAKPKTAQAKVKADDAAPEGETNQSEVVPQQKATPKATPQATPKAAPKATKGNQGKKAAKNIAKQAKIKKNTKK